MEVAPNIQQPIVEQGPGDPVEPPKGYVPTNPNQRKEWNGFLDYLKSQGNINLNDPQVGSNFLNQYKQNNPNFSITPEMIPHIQYEQNQFRKGDSFGGLNEEQLKAARTGMQPNFLNETNLYKSYYPQFKVGSQDFGTDIEGYSKFKGSNNQTTNSQPITEPTRPQGALPLPDYNDPKSRLQFAQNFAKKYPVGPNRGDTPLRINEVPYGGIDTAKDSTIKAASKLGLDPALLYSSAMEEGMSGMFKDKGKEFNEDNTSGNKDYPVDGFHNYGVDNFHDVFPTLVKKGYLPKDFDYQKASHKNENGDPVNSANFKTPDAAMQAKAAYVKYEQDDIEDYIKKKDIPLSDKAKQFFTLINFNGGEGTGHRMIDYYNKRGLLKDDKFLQYKPEPGLKLGQSYDNVLPRVRMADALKKEGLF